MLDNTTNDVKTDATTKGKRNISIHPNPRKWSAKRRAEKKARWLNNRNIRAAHNQEFDGEVSLARAPAYHSRLKALSLGTA
jgi:hypothetical protein